MEVKITQANHKIEGSFIITISVEFVATNQSDEKSIYTALDSFELLFLLLESFTMNEIQIFTNCVQTKKYGRKPIRILNS